MLLRDRIAQPIRNRLGKYYLFGCSKCLSVWSGIACTVALVLCPWLNWPLALSWLYILGWDLRSKYVEPTVQYVPYAPKLDGLGRIREQTIDLLFQNVNLQAVNDQLRDELQRVQTSRS